MASQALYRKWRSRTFDEIIGQEHVTQTLLNALKLGRIAHAYLFSGPRGTGKTSTARLLAKAVNCLEEDIDRRPCNQCAICTAVNEGRLMDLIEIDAASNTGVDDIRDLRDKVGFRPAQAQIKFYIIDEVHMLSNSAFNALLKTLEEPPGHVIFVLATTEPEKIPATITSRCQRFDFKRIRLEDIVQRLAHIVAEEGFMAERAALEQIARQGGGSMRDAISLLDQMVAYGGETITLDLVQSVLGMVASESVIQLVDALIDRDAARGLELINGVVADGIDPRQFAREIVEHLRAVMLIKLGHRLEALNLPDELKAAIQAQATRVEPGFIVRATERFNTALIDLKSSLLAIPQLPLELAFVETVTAPAVTSSPPAVSPPAMTPAPLVVSSPPAKVPAPEAPPAKVTPPRPVASPPPAKAPEAIPVSPDRTEGPLDLEMVKGSLEKVINLIAPRSKPMAEALRTAQLLAVTGDEILIVTFDLMKRRFEKPQPKAAINEAFSVILGQNVSVRFLSDSEAKMAGSARTSDQSGGDEPGEDEDTLALLKMATEELGGKIVE
jgi:DNA polymerase III subunit gamma/tau